MKGCWVRGTIYCALWYSSIFCGFITLCCPFLPLLVIHQRLYRQIMDLIFAIWEMYPVVLMEVLFGTRIFVSGETIIPWERSLLVMNHRTRLDWNFLWAAMFYAAQPPAHRLKFVLKAPIRHMPGPGWVMQCAGFLYIHRIWEQDQALLARSLDYLSDIDHTYQVLIFPEGTDLTERSLKRSNDFADTHHLEHYQQVLHPKTTGFVFLVNKMRQNKQLDAVYDLSVGYPGSLPHSELDVARGIFPEEVHFHVKRYSASDLPSSDINLKRWLTDLWREKEHQLVNFYVQHNFRPHKVRTGTPPKSKPMSNALLLALFFWTGLVFATLCALAFSTIFQLWALTHCTLFIVLSLTTEGVNHLEVSWFRFKQRQYINHRKQN